MQISNQLLKPLLDKMEDEYHELESQLALFPSDKSEKIRASIRQNLREIERLELCGFVIDDSVAAVLTPKAYETVRKIKLNLRFLQRRWQRYLSIAKRMRGLDRDEVHLPTIAA